MSARPLIVVAGVGAGKGTGGSTARLFAKEGYRVALIARGADSLNALAAEINQAGGEAAAFPIPEYSYKGVLVVFDSILSHTWPSPGATELRVALWNASAGAFKNFLDVTEEDIQNSVNLNVVASFAFSRRAVLAFKENTLDANGARGTLLFTGATAAIRGNTWTSAFAAGKFGLRALSHSLAKEFGKENIHVAHAIIDGVLKRERHGSKPLEEGQEEANVRLNPDAIAKTYKHLVEQDRSSWSWEIDLRPAHEKW
ncbi:NAD-P-binding protein [Epithele typhae]|uniref:NAD-P-binding protein n=1 Tax=Epithele typhae TaxID=378194 RepID=UPI002007FF46|nr:NAD-P-binding protein [Epithele typhae]KAH9945061.1 NAD-P-binding protein [Epithele typhae]